MKGKTDSWTKEELSIIERLNSPERIQEFLDSTPYDPREGTDSPRCVMRDRKAHCFEGALFAMACMQHHKINAGIVDLRAVRDDDHTIVVFKKGKLYGAVSKSNFSTLRYREPVYTSIRELVMSYFELYFNAEGEKTLREFSVPITLKRFDKINWKTTEKKLDVIGEYLDGVKHYRIAHERDAKKFMKVKGTLLKAGFLGTDPQGLYKKEK